MDGQTSTKRELALSETSSTGSCSTHSPPGPISSKENVVDVEKRDAEVADEGGHEAVQLPSFPEGGLRAWLTVLGGTMVTFCTFGVVQSFGVYQDYYSRTSLSEHSPSQISLIGSMQVFFVFALGLPAGRLFDAGYFHHCLLTGSVIYIFSIFMLSLAEPHHYYQNLLSQGVGMGIGMGMMFLPCLTITSHYFRVKRSMAMGIVIAGSSLGGVVYPVLLNNIFQRSSGFEWGVRGVAFMDLGFLIIANSIMRTRLPPKKTQGDGSGATFRTVLSDVPFLIYILGAFLVFWGIFVPFFYLQLYAALHGVNPMFTNYSITIMNASSVFGRTVPNFLADYYGPLNVMIPSAIIAAGLIFGMFGATSIAGVTVFGVFYGFFSGGLVSVAAPAVASFVTHRDLSDLGIRIGMLSFSLAFALLTGNPIAGALLTAHHVWHRPLIFAAATVFMGAVCHILIWKSIKHRRGSSKI
jgi:MFS family permease